MKAFLTKLNSLQKTLFFSLVIGIVLCLLSIVGLVFSQPGWMIGVALGTAAAMVNVVLLFKGSELILKSQKAGLFVLMFLARMLVIVAIFALCVLLQFKAHIPAFTNSIWGAFIGFAPSVVLIVIFQTKTTDNEKGEK